MSIIGEQGKGASIKVIRQHKTSVSFYEVPRHVRVCTGNTQAFQALWVPRVLADIALVSLLPMGVTGTY